MPKIYYKSEPIEVRSPPQESLYDAVINGLRIFDQVEPNCDNEVEEGSVTYRVCIETDAETVTDTHENLHKATELITDLERVWVYALGEPMRALRLSLQIDNGPEGWETNFEEVKAELETAEGGLYGTVFVSSRHWIKITQWPLRRAVAALGPYSCADHNIRALIELHFDALRATRRQGRLFLLAKAMELVHSLLPGNSKKQREENLTPAVKANLTQKLDWLYDIGNNRADTRHIVKPRSKPLDLHPQMTPTEREEYEKNADLVIRDVISRQLGIDCAIPQSRRTSSA